MAKTPAKRAVRRAPLTRLSESAAAGAPAPASAAATAPPPGPFYDPSVQQQPSPALAAMRQLEQGAETDTRRALHSAAVADRTIMHEGLSAGLDPEIVEAAAAPIAPVPENETLEQQVARIRTMRRPLGAFSQKLALAERPGYKRHWFNDTGDRIGSALNNGWAHVRGRDGQNLHRAVGTGRDKGVLYAYAMEIPKIFWEEDMAERHKLAAEKVAALKTSPGRADGKAVRADRSDQGKFYSPAEDTGREFLEISKA